MTDFEKFQWVFAAVVFVSTFIVVFLWSFVTSCIFHWPIRWDVAVCWGEQIQPAQEEAAQNAVNFIP